MDKLTIRGLIERIEAGDIRIPAFQRDFVWDYDQISFLMDSIYKKFPIGSIFLWKTDNRLSSEKKLGQFTLPDPKKDYPVNYVLDGQQRITSLYTVFQTLHENTEDDVKVYFNMSMGKAYQDSCFSALPTKECDPEVHFPINCFFDSIAYRIATKNLDDSQVTLVDEVQSIFKEYMLPHEVFESDDRNEVAIVFERINRQGTELSNFDLLSAWSWSEEFDLNTKFKDLDDELESIGYSGLKDKRDLLLRICAAVLKGKPTPAATLGLAGEEVRQRFDEIENGIKGAIDFLKKELSVHSFEMLPYPALLTPLTVFFASKRKEGQIYNDAQRAQLVRWFWTTLFAKRYMSDSTKRQERDIEEFLRLKENTKYVISISPLDMKISFRSDQFGNNMPTKTFLLLLANQRPCSLLTGAKIDPAKVLMKVNKNEFHHIFPKKYLRHREYKENEINALSNLCYLTRGDNNTISGNSPKNYNSMINKIRRDDLLNRAFIPNNFHRQNYEDFLKRRTELLEDKALELMEIES